MLLDFNHSTIGLFHWFPKRLLTRITVTITLTGMTIILRIHSTTLLAIVSLHLIPVAMFFGICFQMAIFPSCILVRSGRRNPIVCYQGQNRHVVALWLPTHWHRYVPRCPCICQRLSILLSPCILHHWFDVEESLQSSKPSSQPSNQPSSRLSSQQFTAI